MSLDPDVCLVTYRRTDTIAEVARAWRHEPVGEIWLADCSLGKIQSGTMDQLRDAGVKIVSFSHDPGNKARHAIAHLTRSRFVIQSDDDVVPEPGLVTDFIHAYDKLGRAAILGLIGRRFHGPSYYKDTEFFCAQKVLQYTRVNMVGICYFSPREALQINLERMASPINDLYWTSYLLRTWPKFVIPTKRYHNLPSSKDGSCLFHNPKAREERELFYGQYCWDPKEEIKEGQL